jgi:hypothetical protein
MPVIPTLLVLSGVGIPPYSARGLSETLAPIGAATQLRRTVNGALKDVADPLFRKYTVSISGNDMDPPAADLVWPGRAVTVDCITELARLASTDEDTTEAPGEFGRSVVPGSIRIEGDFVFYRPRLSMRVTGWSADSDEWAAVRSWTLTLEEV